jgi:hypothetical protein
MPLVGPLLKDVERCPQCGVANPMLEYTHHFSDDLDNSAVLRVWFVYRCSSCQDLVAAMAYVNKDKVRSSNFVTVWLRNNPMPALRVIPGPEQVDEDLPDRPRCYLQQALNSLSAPDGAIMLAGSAIDAMLKLKGYTEGSVYSRIEKAVKDHVLTEDMSKWAHAVRLESNKPRHADLEEPHGTKEQAELTIKFAQALGEFLFVLPARIAKGTEESERAVPPE